MLDSTVVCRRALGCEWEEVDSLQFEFWSTSCFSPATRRRGTRQLTEKKKKKKSRRALSHI